MLISTISRRQLDGEWTSERSEGTQAATQNRGENNYTLIVKVRVQDCYVGEQRYRTNP